MKNYILIFCSIIFVSFISTETISKKVPDMLGSYGGWKNYFDTIKDIKVSGVRIKQIRLKDDRCPNGFIDHLEFEGIINEDTSFIVESLLEEILHDIGACEKFSRIVTMHSEGGYLLEGIYLGRVFNYYGVSTALYPGHRCSSACAIAFVGGTYRFMAPDTELMVHTPYLQTASSIHCVNLLEDESMYLAQYYMTALGTEDGYTFWEKTMSNCSQDNGWTINADAAKIYGITNIF